MAYLIRRSNSVIGGAMKRVALLSVFFAAGSVAQATADTIQGFVYTAGTFTTFDLPGPPSGINDTGQIVGQISGPGGEGFLYSGGTITTIGVPLGARETQFRGINDAGQVVGYFIDSSFGVHGFLYDAGTYTSIDVPGAKTLITSGINKPARSSVASLITSMSTVSVRRGHLHLHRCTWREIYLC